jgi:hypothetical protein
MSPYLLDPSFPFCCQRTKSDIRQRFEIVLLSSYLFLKSDVGGGERDRTDDLLLAKQALSQLSYTPTKICYTNFRVKS